MYFKGELILNSGSPKEQTEDQGYSGNLLFSSDSCRQYLPCKALTVHIPEFWACIMFDILSPIYLVSSKLRLFWSIILSIAVVFSPFVHTTKFYKFSEKYLSRPVISSFSL